MTQSKRFISSRSCCRDCGTFIFTKRNQELKKMSPRGAKFKPVKLKYHQIGAED